jgi:PAS domain S-box-containing protein
MGLGSKVIAPYLLLFISWLGLCGYFVFEYKNSIAEQDKLQLDGLAGSYRSAYRNFENAYNLFFISAINKPYIKKILKDARENEPKNEKLREQLHEHLKNEFTNLQKLGFSNIAFTFTDGTIFLRMNNLNFYGDRIDEKRPLVNRVKKTIHYESDFEVGKLVAGFTFCHPLILNGEFVGIVFASISAKSFAQTMSLDLPGKFGFIIDKKELDSVMLDTPKKNYPESYLSNKFYRDESFEIDNTSKYFKKNLKEQAKATNLLEYKPAILHTDMTSSNAAISLLPVKMSSGKYGAYFAHYGSDTHYTNMKKELIVKLLSISILFTGLLIGFMRRQKLDNELADSETEYRVLFEQAAVGFSYIHRSGKFLEVNEKLCRMFGYSKNEMMNISFQMLAHPDELAFAEKSFELLLNDKEYIFNYRFRFKKKDDSYLWTNISARSFSIGNSGNIAVIATIEDISEQIETERRLEQQGMQMQAIVNGVPSMIFIKNSKHEWIFGNKAVCDFMGQDLQSLQSKNNYDLSPANEAVNIRNDDNRVLAGETLLQYEEAITNARGEVRILMTSKTPFRLLDGSMGLLAIATDITDSKTAKQTMQRWGMAFNAIREPIFLHDKECRIIEVNKAYLERVGIGIEEIIDKHYWDVFPKTNGPMDSCVATLKGEKLDGIEEFKTETGEIFLIRNLGVLNDTGEHQFSMHILEDITKQYEAKHTSEMLNKFFDNTAEGVIIADKDGIILSVNPAFTKISGYETGDLVGKKPSILQSGYHSKEFYEKMWSAILQNGKWEGEITNKRKNGETYPEWLTITKILDNNGNIENFIAITMDMSQIYCDREKIEAQDKMILSQSRFAAMGEMISMIAHQWRQPITAIGMGVNNMLLDIELGDIEPKVFEKHLEIITGQVQFLSQTIDDFRNFFRPQTDMQILKVDALVHSAIKIVGKSLENNGIKLELEISDCLVEVYEGEFVQVLLVILGNAKDAFLDKKVDNPTIQIKCGRKYDEFVELTISDNAGGVPDDMMQKIFEPYFTTKEAKNGTGLGLYIAKSIIEKHQGGSMGIKNENGGATFWIRLPLRR